MINRLFTTALLLCLLPAAAAFGQELRKEDLKKKDAVKEVYYAVFYSYGMPESAVWPLGMKLSRDGATIRHTHAGGNGDNLPINDRVPFRFIIALADENGGNTRFWAAAMGIHGGDNGDNENLNADGNFDASFSGGCKNYSTPEFPDGWRLPTQREMMLMWLFREGINTIYSNGQLGSPGGVSRYWTATESSPTEAWCFDFTDGQPQSVVATKANPSGSGVGSGSYKVRCVRDY